LSPDYLGRDSCQEHAGMTEGKNYKAKTYFPSTSESFAFCERCRTLI
jgi:hypothetical protein